MTVLDKRNRIERLAEEPLFYYRTLRDRVEELDSLKAAFQYLLAAYELNMDPAIKAQYEDAKRAAVEAQLRESAVAMSAAQQGQAPGFVQHGVNDPGLSHPPEILAKMESERTGTTTVEVVKGSGMPDARRPELAPKVPRPISPRAGVVAEAVKEIRAAAHPGASELADVNAPIITDAQKQRIATWGKPHTEQGEDNPLIALSNESILEAKRVLSRAKVAEEVNKILISHGIHFDDAHLIDYMSKADLERIGRMVEAREAHHDHNPIEKHEVDTFVEQADEFPLTQVGMAQKMFYGEEGLLAKILGPTLTRYGKGPIDTHDADTSMYGDTVNAADIVIGPVDTSGIYRHGPGCYGVFIILTATPQHPREYQIWLPLYKEGDTKPPMIFCATLVGSNPRALTQFSSSEVSDIVNRLVGYIVKWQSIVLSRQAMDAKRPQAGVDVSINKRQLDPSEYVADGASLVLIGKEAEKLVEAKVEWPPASKEYPITTPLGQLQRQVYSADGLLALLLGPTWHKGGRGPIMDVTGQCSAESIVILPGEPPVMGFTISAAVNGVWVTEKMVGVLMRCDRGVDFWLPVHTLNSEELPSIYVSPTIGGLFRNLDVFGPRDIQVLGDFLIANLETWIKSVN
jgi:hypothetical protein